MLEQQGYKADDILPKGVQVFLRRNSNISTGGDSVDVTEIMHASYKELATETATAMGAWVCGVDLIISDSTLPASKKSPTAPASNSISSHIYTCTPIVQKDPVKALRLTF